MIFLFEKSPNLQMQLASKVFIKILTFSWVAADTDDRMVFSLSPIFFVFICEVLKFSMNKYRQPIN